MLINDTLFLIILYESMKFLLVFHLCSLQIKKFNIRVVKFIYILYSMLKIFNLLYHI